GRVRRGPAAGDDGRDLAVAGHRRGGDEDVGSLAGGPDPLDGHGRGRVALPGQEEGIRGGTGSVGGGREAAEQVGTGRQRGGKAPNRGAEEGTAINREHGGDSRSLAG